MKFILKSKKMNRALTSAKIPVLIGCLLLIVLLSVLLNVSSLPLIVLLIIVAALITVLNFGLHVLKLNKKLAL